MTVETSPQQPATRTEAFKAIWEILEEDPLTCQKGPASVKRSKLSCLSIANYWQRPGLQVS